MAHRQAESVFPTARWRPGRRAEAVAIALLIQILMVLTLLVADRFYVAGLAFLSRPGRPTGWLLRPGEAGLTLVLALAAGGWLTGAWLGERRRRDWAVLGLLTLALSTPLLWWLDRALGATQPRGRFAPPGLGPEALWLLAPAVLLAGLVLGGLLGAWWAGLGPDE